MPKNSKKPAAQLRKLTVNEKLNLTKTSAPIAVVGTQQAIEAFFEKEKGSAVGPGGRGIYNIPGFGNAHFLSSIHSPDKSIGKMGRATIILLEDFHAELLKYSPAEGIEKYHQKTIDTLKEAYDNLEFDPSSNSIRANHDALLLTDKELMGQGITTFTQLIEAIKNPEARIEKADKLDELHTIYDGLERPFDATTMARQTSAQLEKLLTEARDDLAEKTKVDDAAAAADDFVVVPDATTEIEALKNKHALYFKKANALREKLGMVARTMPEAQSAVMSLEVATAMAVSAGFAGGYSYIAPTEPASPLDDTKTLTAQNNELKQEIITLMQTLADIDAAVEYEVVSADDLNPTEKACAKVDEVRHVLGTASSLYSATNSADKAPNENPSFSTIADASL